MSNAIVPITQSEWTRERLDLLKRTVCPKGISDDEFALFVEQCKRSGLDPLVKEAYCVPRRQNIGTKERPEWVTKHEFQPSEAGMLARAEKFADFRGVTASVVCASDPIEIDTGAGTVSHKFAPGPKRGPILGAWSRLLRDGKEPTVVWLDIEGYRQQNVMWSKIPATMIEKCARVAALRKAYPSAFGGLYIAEEMQESEPVARAEVIDQPKALPATGKRVAELKQQIAAKLSRETKPEPTRAEPHVELDEPKQRKMPLIEDEPKATPWELIQAVGKLYGKEGKALGGIVRGVTGKSGTSTLTHDDVEKVTAALQAVAKPPPDEVPLPSDEDAPPEVA